MGTSRLLLVFKLSDDNQNNIKVIRKENISLKVNGLNLVGEVYFPETEAQLHPALCICHGVPAAAYNPADVGYPALAQKFCAAGFITLIFNFRGAGKSQGNLDLLGWSQDLKAALNFLSNLKEVDKAHICLLGFSGGAAVSVYVAAHDSRVSSLAACACLTDFSFLTDDEEKVLSLIQHFRSIGVIRDKGFPPSAEKWLDGFNAISPIRWINGISPRPLLLVHGSEDDIIPVSHAWKLYERAKEPKQITIIPGAKHRLRLEDKAMAITLDWLKNKCQID